MEKIGFIGLGIMGKPMALNLIKAGYSVAVLTQSRILDLHGKRMIERNFAPGFKIKLHNKDMGIALQTGQEFSVPLKGTALVTDQMKAAVDAGNGELDHSAILLQLEARQDFDARQDFKS